MSHPQFESDAITMTRNDRLTAPIRHIQIAAVELSRKQVTEVTDAVKMTGHCGMNFFSGRRDRIRKGAKRKRRSRFAPVLAQMLAQSGPPTNPSLGARWQTHRTNTPLLRFCVATT